MASSHENRLQPCWGVKMGFVCTAVASYVCPPGSNGALWATFGFVTPQFPPHVKPNMISCCTGAYIIFCMYSYYMDECIGTVRCSIINPPGDPSNPKSDLMDEKVGWVKMK